MNAEMAWPRRAQSLQDTTRLSSSVCGPRHDGGFVENKIQHFRRTAAEC